MIFTISAALADHMTGKYVGTDQAVATLLNLQQDGVDLSGQLSGGDIGTLTGTTDGGDNVSGFVDLQGVGRYQFEGSYTAEGFTLTLVGSEGMVSFLFVRDSGGGVTPEPKKPAMDTYYLYENGEQVGPLTSDEMLGRIADGGVTRETLVWKPGQADWVRADAVPELAAALPPALPSASQYYVAENGEQVGPLTLDEVLAKIAAGTVAGADVGWTNGMADWAPLSTFAEFEAALVVPPPPPTDTTAGSGPPALPEETSEDGPPPLDPAADEDPAMDTEAPTTDAPAAEGGTNSEEEATAPTEPDPLRAVVDESMASGLSQYSDEERAGFADCAMTVFEALAAEDRKLLVDTRLELSTEQGEAFDAKYPGLNDKARACAATE